MRRLSLLAPIAFSNENTSFALWTDDTVQDKQEWINLSYDILSYFKDKENSKSSSSNLHYQN